jgi:putative tributyrin esterase
MTYIRLTFSSEMLHGNTDVSVFYPDPPRLPGPPGPRPEATGSSKYDKRKRYQVLWLMHGGGGDYTDWPLDAMIQRKCNAAQIIVVMPTIRDFVSMMSGADYLRYVAEELPEFIGFLFPISRKREDNFIAGLSYGGYFSYRVALNYPEQYACVGSFSSPLDVAMDIQRYHADSPTHPRYDTIAGTDLDVMGMAARLKEAGHYIPRMYQACGTEDFTWDFNISARDHFRSLSLDHTWVQGTGAHTFEFWDEHLKRFIDWLPLKGAGFIPGEEE